MASCPASLQLLNGDTMKEAEMNGVQKALMLDFVNSHLGSLLQGNMDPCHWTLLVQQLNAVSGGATHTSDEWRQGLWDNLRTQLPARELEKFGFLRRGKGLVDGPSRISGDCLENGPDNQVAGATVSKGSTALEKILMRKLVKSDQIKIRYLKRKLKMEGQYHKTKLSLMRDMLLVKQRKVKVEEKQATALLRIARSLDRLLQNRRIEQL